MRKIYISPSGLASYENCQRAYWYDRVAKVKTAQADCNLGFGGSAASAMEAFMRGRVQGVATDPVADFEAHWEAFTTTNNVRYKKGRDRQVMSTIGKKLMEQFPAAFDQSGYTIAIDAFGRPMIERKLMVDVGHGVILVCKIDVAVFDSDGRFLIVDQKTPASETSVEFTLMGDQLTAYQLAVTAHGLSLGLPKVDGVGYWELIKRDMPKTGRGEGPVIRPPKIVEPRTQEEIYGFIAKLHDTADRIRAGQFHRMPRMAFNTPCSGCDFAAHCIRSETTGLVFPEGFNIALDSAPAALPMAA